MPPIQRSATLPIPPVYVSGLTLVNDEGGIDEDIMDEDDNRPIPVAKGVSLSTFGGNMFQSTQSPVPHKPQVEMGTFARFQQSPVVEPVVPSVTVPGSVHVQQGTPMSVVTEGKIENQEHSGPTKWTDVGESESMGKATIVPPTNTSNVSLR